MSRAVICLAVGSLAWAGAAQAQSSGNMGALLGGGAQPTGQTRSASSSGVNERSRSIGNVVRFNNTHIGGVSLNPQLSYSTSSAANGISLGDAASGAGVKVSSGSAEGSQATRSGSTAVPVQIDGSTLGGGALGFTRSTGSRSATDAANSSRKTR